MREFARKLVLGTGNRRVTGGIGELEEAGVGDILDALIHQGVKTPRHVIRLINAFNGDYHLALVREARGTGLLSEKALTGSLPFLAVITCLREDFPAFYAEITRNRSILRAMDMLLDGSPASQVDHELPGAVELCRPYFVSSGEEGQTIDVSKPQNWKLILYLRDTAKFRVSASLVPFLYFRENEAARLLGSELHERMASEFGSNYALGLRTTISDGGEAYAQAAAQVALYCLEENKGGRLTNTLIAASAVFGLFTSDLKARVADRIALRLSQNRGVISSCDTDQLLDVLQAAPPSTYREACVQDIVRNLESETGTGMLVAILRHAGLIDISAHGLALSKHSQSLAATLPVADLQPLFQLVSEVSGDSRVVDGFFGAGFLSTVAEVTSAAKAEILISGYSDGLRDLFMAMEPTALQGWSQEYYGTAVTLLNSRAWGAHDVGFDVLEDHQEQLGLATAQRAVETLFADKNLPSDTELERHVRTLEFAVRIAEKHGKEPFLPDGVKTALNSYFSTWLISTKQEIRLTCRRSLEELVSALGADYFLPTAKELVTFIPTNMPDASAEDGRTAAFMLADALTKADLEGLLGEMTAELLVPSPTENARFGADSLNLAFTQKASVKLRSGALDMVPQLVSLVDTANAPGSLIYVATVLDNMSPMLGEDAAAYLANIVKYMEHNVHAYMEFALNRISVLALAGLVTDEYKAIFSRSFIERWDYLPGAAQKRQAAEMLAEWQSAIPAANRPLYWQQQVQLLDTVLEVAWKNLRSCWGAMTTQLRQQTLLKISETGDLWQQVLSDLSQQRATLSPDMTTDLLLELEEQLGQPQYVGLIGALTSRLSASDKNEVSKQIFSALSDMPDAAGHQELARLAGRLASETHSEGFSFFFALLRADLAYRNSAFSTIDEFLANKTPSEDQRAEMSAILAQALTSDPNESAVRNAEVAYHNGFASAKVYAEAMRERLAAMKSSQDNNDKETIKRLRGLARK